MMHMSHLRNLSYYSKSLYICIWNHSISYWIFK